MPITAVTGRGRIEPDLQVAPKLRVGLEINEAPSHPGETIQWNGKTYRIRHLKKGKECFPTSQAEWEKLKSDYLKFLETVNKVDDISGSTKLSFSFAKKTLTATSNGKSKVIEIGKLKLNSSEKAEFQRLTDTIGSFVLEKFTSEIPFYSEVKSIETKPSTSPEPLLGNEALQDIDVITYLERLRSDRPDKLAFAFIGPQTVNRGGIRIPVALDFVTPFDSEYEKNPALQKLVDNRMLFAMPYLVDAKEKEMGHFKLVLIDFENAKIYHYDSLGYKPNAPLSAKLDALAEDLRGKYPEKEWSIKYNSKKHQLDGISCGQFVLNFVHEAVNGTDLEQYMERELELPKVKQNLADYFSSEAPVCSNEEEEQAVPIATPQPPAQQVPQPMLIAPPTPTQTTAENATWGRWLNRTADWLVNGDEMNTSDPL